MKIVVYLRSLTGVELHRLILPYSKVKENSNIQISWLTQGKDITKDNIADIVKDYDIFVFSRMMPEGYIEALKGKITLINDTDDYWVLDNQHPLYNSYKLNNITNKLIHHLKMADYVTTTTQLLADKIKPLNSNVVILPNALCAEGQFEHKNKPHSRRIRFGIIGSSSHTFDMELLKGINQYLTDEDREKMEWVLCGFDKGYTYNYKDGKYINTVQTPWQDVCWTKWEKMLTDDYKYVTPQHKEFLTQYIEGADDYDTDYYRRFWTRSVENYATLYDEIDVLVTPLQNTNFNKYKSNLKMVEAGIKHKGLIISDVQPYTPYLVNIVDNDKFNLQGNCIAVRDGKGAKGFAKAIKKIINNPSILPIMSQNLSELVDDKFNLNKITEDRVKFLNSIWKQD